MFFPGQLDVKILNINFVLQNDSSWPNRKVRPERRFSSENHEAFSLSSFDVLCAVMEKEVWKYMVFFDSPKSMEAINKLFMTVCQIWTEPPNRTEVTLQI